MSDLINRFIEEGMMWESPIKVMQKQVKMQMEGEILKAVQEVGIVVDKEELMKALKHDREQYEKGYADGFNSNKWIPVEERLPEIEEEVLVCTKGKMLRVWSLTEDDDELTWEDGYGYWNRFDCVIAWMPLPEAYKGE